MAGAECEAAGPGNTVAPRLVFLIPSLDAPWQRQEVLKKTQEYIVAECLETTGGITYVGQAGWEEAGQVWSLTSHLMSVCRSLSLVPSERCVLLALHDQYQAIQLCLARLNKVRQGEFMAAASDVLDVWNAMYRETVAAEGAGAEETEALEELSHITSRQTSCDPRKQELQEVIKDYQEFLTNSLCVDHFRVFACLQRLLKDEPALFRDVFSKVFIIEGLEQLPLMERALLKLVSEGSQVYRVHAELPFSEAIPPSPSTLNISGIHESSILKTPSRCNEQETVQSDSMTPEFKATNAPQTPTPQHRHQADQTDSTTDNAKTTRNPQTPCHDTRQTDQTDSVRRNTQEKAIIQVERVEGSMTEVVDGAPHYAAKAVVSSESEAYIERLFLAHLRLLVNTRDELALTLACSMPGREITHQGFTDIRQEAQRKEMPMYQTILSLILRQRLGGKGYQADPNNPVLLHAKPLGEFVDALMKLQNILEGQTDARQGAIRVLNGIKTGLGKMKGCMLKRSTIEAVAERLCVALQHLMEAPQGGDSARAIQGNKGNKKPSNLHPSLKHLVHLCDVAGGQAGGGGVVDALGDDLLSQLTSTKKGPHNTPLRIHSVLSLFRSPVGGMCDRANGMEEEDLETRVRGNLGQAATTPAQLKRYKSDCSWAPIDLSPITASMQDTSASPIAGPSLKVVGRAARHSSGGSKESVASLTRDEDNCGDPPSEGRSSPPQPSSPVTPRRLKDNNNKPKKARSKRSLLKDISNLENKSEETQEKKQKVMPGNKEGAKRRKEKSKPLLQGQRSITSFFRS